MIFSDVELKELVKPLSVLSLDDSGNSKAVSMLSSEQKAVDFDAVKKFYFKQIKGGCATFLDSEGNKIHDYMPSSADALFYTEGGMLIFVEFKNGEINGKTKRNVREKMLESVMIYGDLKEKCLRYFQNYAEFILVYNKRKNVGKLQNGVKVTYPISNPLNDIASHFLELGDQELVLLGLEKYQGFCYRKVHTFDVDQMNAWLEKNSVSVAILLEQIKNSSIVQKGAPAPFLV
jgi:hypothetical protein